MGWTKKERVMAVLNGEVPDRVPVFDYLINDRVLEHFNNGRSIDIGDRKSIIKACSNCLDICHPVTDAPYLPSRQALPDGGQRIYERWTSWDIQAPGKKIEDMLCQIESEIGLFRKGDIKSYDPGQSGVVSLSPQMEETDPEANILAGQMMYINAGTSVFLLPGTIEEGIYLYADYSELIEEWNKVRNRFTLEWLDSVADPAVCPVIIVWNDLGIKGRLIYPPYMLEKLFYPHLHNICDLIHSKGMKVIFHSDGYITQALDPLEKCGIDGLNPLEISAGMNVADFKEKYGKKITIVGGLDAVDVLAHGSVDKVVEETKRLIAVGGKNGGLITGSASGEIDNSMPYENVIAYLETVWEYGVY